MTKKKIMVVLLPALALFGAAVLIVLLIRSAMNAKENGVPFFKMLGYELKFIFSFSKWGSFEVG